MIGVLCFTIIALILSILIVFLNDVISGKDEDSNRRGIERTRVFKYLDGNNCKRLYEWMKLKG